MSSLWNICLSKLENEMPSTDFNTWIRPLQVIETKDNLNLLAPNRFVLDYVQRHYIEKINDAVIEFSNGKLHLSLDVGSNRHSAMPVAATSSTSAIEEEKAIPQNFQTFLNKSFTFENFIEGKSNQFARAAALQVSENSGKAYNPLLIYGGSGLGKTHIMHAVGNAILNKHPSIKVVYLHSERFVQDMVKALQKNAIHTFKEFYRAVDVLLIDDIQFFAGKDRSQEEFFHTFNSLIDRKHQIVLTCDKYPKEISGLEERLKSRFSCGLPVSIEPPDMETRAAILMKKATIAQINLPDEVAFYIAKRMPYNVRDLEGALRRLIANAEFTGQAITLDFAKDVLQDLVILQDKLVNIDTIQNTVAHYYNIQLNELLGSNKLQTLTRPRQIAMTLARELTPHSFPEIGNAFGGRNHTTVISACKKIDELRKTDPKLSEDYVNLVRMLSS
jgi:chromosomal replication initiator protein